MIIAKEMLDTLLEEYSNDNPLLVADGDSQSNPSLDFNGIKVSLSDISEIRIANDLDKIRISPNGASVAIKLYYAGAWFRKAPNTITPAPQELLDYTNSEEELIERTSKDRLESIKKETAYKEKLKHPERINEQEFTFKLLNDIFIMHLGIHRSSRSMIVGDRVVTKILTPYSSNSGKNRDCEVTFCWEDSSGVNRSFSKRSIFIENRRNDSERNFGLSNSRRVI